MTVTAHLLSDGSKLCPPCAKGRGETFHRPTGVCAECGLPLDPEYEAQRFNIIFSRDAGHMTTETALILLRGLEAGR